METDYPGGAAAWFADDLIYLKHSNDKTEVTIQLPEDARLQIY